MSDGSRWRSCVAQSAIPVGTRGPDDCRFAFRRARRHQDGHGALAAAIGDASAASRCDPGNRTSVVCSNVPDPSASATRWRFVGRENAGAKVHRKSAGLRYDPWHGPQPGNSFETLRDQIDAWSANGDKSCQHELAPPVCRSSPCCRLRHENDRTRAEHSGNAEFESGARRSEYRNQRAGNRELPIWVALNRQPGTIHLIEWLIDLCDKPWSGKVHATIVRLD
jgi:hypothetical protein